MDASPNSFHLIMEVGSFTVDPPGQSTTNLRVKTDFMVTDTRQKVASLECQSTLSLFDTELERVNPTWC